MLYNEVQYHTGRREERGLGEGQRSELSGLWQGICDMLRETV